MLDRNFWWIWLRRSWARRGCYDDGFGCVGFGCIICKYLEQHGSYHSCQFVSVCSHREYQIATKVIRGSLFTVHVTLGMAVGIGVTVAVDAAVGIGSLTLICQLLSLLVWPPFSIHYVH